MAYRSALFAIPFLFSTSFAVADDARENVVVIAVTKASVPGKLPGLCQINGTVGEVWEGKAFRKGQAISLPVPCGSHAQPLRPPGANAQLADPQVLLKSKQAIAHLDDAGALVWRETARAFGGVGRVSGYRVFDGAMLPLRQAAL
jgi:hypothetical protein